MSAFLLSRPPWPRSDYANESLNVRSGEFNTNGNVPSFTNQTMNSVTAAKQSDIRRSKKTTSITRFLNVNHRDSHEIVINYD